MTEEESQEFIRNKKRIKELEDIIRKREENSKTNWVYISIFIFFTIFILTLWSFLGREWAFSIGAVVITIFVIWVSN